MTSRPKSAARPSEGKSGPFPVWRIGFLVLCAVGMYFSADLLRLHVKVYTDPDYHAFCAVSEQLNCETVAASTFSVFAGLPVAFWGIVGYLFMGGLCLWGLADRQQKPATWPLGFLFWLSLLAVLASAALFVISHKAIGALCLLCMATYAVNFLLFGLTTLELIRVKSGPLTTLRADFAAFAARRTPFSLFLASFILMPVLVWATVPAYWEAKITTGPGGILAGKTAEGFDWIGARRPVLRITEFSDYQCPYCSRGHARVRSLVARHPDEIRLVHRHLPISRHKYAYAYAAMAHCAGAQDRFWEANDYLFENGRRKNPVSPTELAGAIGIDPDRLAACLAADETKAAIAGDVGAARELKIRGTPTYVIGDRLYPGKIPPEILSAALEQQQKD